MHFNKSKSIIKRIISGILTCSLAVSSITSIAFATEPTVSTTENHSLFSTGITVTVDENGNVITANNNSSTTIITDTEKPNYTNENNDISDSSSTSNTNIKESEEPNINTENNSYDSISENTTSGVDPPTFNKYYSLIDDNIIQTNTLFIKTNNKNVFTKNTNIISNYDNVYIISCKNIQEARYVYSYYVNKVDYISDLSNVIALASNTTNTPTSNTTYENAIAILNEIDIKDYSGYIALIDTGANGADSSLSVMNDDGYDFNGHGTSMLNFIKKENNNAKVLSIKAFDNQTTNTATLYAGIKLAIESNVSVINLSIAGYDIEKNAIIKDVIQEAINKGITVVGAAGNYNMSAKKFIPGSVDGVITVGAINPDKTKYSTSNYDADIYVVATSSSEATARYAGMLTANKIDSNRTTTKLVGEENNNNNNSSTGTHSDKKAA